jgi:hypothetical protein
LSETTHLAQMFNATVSSRACLGRRRQWEQEGEALGRSRGSWPILGDGVNQAADLATGATSIPSRNLTPLMTFGNWF